MTMVRTSAQMATPSTVSPKALLALLFPSIGTAVLVVLHVLLDPRLDPELVVAIVGVVDALLAGLGAYVGAPGQVVVPE